MNQPTGLRLGPKWREANNLVLNIAKTKELLIDFRSGELVVNEQLMERVDTFAPLHATL